MGSNSFGQHFTVTTFGESHGPAMGVVVDGCPSGVQFDEEILLKELKRRRPGFDVKSSSRRESDLPVILSGVFEGKTTGTAIGLLIENTDQRSKDYGNIKDQFRPAHAD